MRRWLIRGAGGLVILAALAYLALNVAEQRAALAQWRPTAGTWPRLALLAGAYGAALFLLAESWHRIAGAFGTEPRWRTFPSYTATLVARYLPGNVMHLLGRAAWLRGGSLGDGQLARATLLELLITPLGAATALAAVLPLLPEGALGAQAAGWSRAADAAPWAVAGFALLALSLRGVRARVRALAVPLVLATLFMLCLSAVFAGVAGLVADVPAGLAMLAGLAAWIAGYATPGAPGGLGPREAVIALLLAGSAAPDDALLVALLFRLVTTGGEVACFAAGYPLGRALRAAAPAAAR